MNKHLLAIFRLILLVLLLLVIPSINPVTGVDVIEWADDFNDGDLDGWRAEGYYAPLSGSWSYYTTGEMSNTDNVLRLSGEHMFRNGTFAIHESFVGYGSWSFDFEVKSILGSSNHTHVYFIDGRQYNASHAFDNGLCCYDIMASSSQWSPSVGVVPEYTKEVYDLSPAFFLVRRPGVQILGYYQAENIDGWNHIDITRNNTGHFKVYINDTLRIEATDNAYRKSKSFWFTGEKGTYAGIDNIIVKSSPPTTTSSNSSTNTSLSESESSSDESGFSKLFLVNTATILTTLSISRKRGKRKGNIRDEN